MSCRVRILQTQFAEQIASYPFSEWPQVKSWRTRFLFSFRIFSIDWLLTSQLKGIIYTQLIGTGNTFTVPINILWTRLHDQATVQDVFIPCRTFDILRRHAAAVICKTLVLLWSLVTPGSQCGFSQFLHCKESGLSVLWFSSEGSKCVGVTTRQRRESLCHCGIEHRSRISVALDSIVPALCGWWYFFQASFQRSTDGHRHTPLALLLRWRPNRS